MTDIAENTVKYALIREMRRIKEQIKQRDETIPVLAQQLADARGERVEFIEKLDALEQHAEKNQIYISPSETNPPVDTESRPPRKQGKALVNRDDYDDEDEDPFG